MLSKQQQRYVDAIIAASTTVGLDCTTPEFTREQLRAVSMIHKGKKWIPNWITHDVSRRVGRGVFSIPEAQGQDHDPAADSQSPKSGEESDPSIAPAESESSVVEETHEATPVPA